MSLTKTFQKLKDHSNENIGVGIAVSLIESLESNLNIRFPDEFRQYLLEIGYAEIFGDEIYSIYDVPDEIPCKGLSWMNKKNEFLSDGYLEFFSNDLDGVYYLKLNSGEVFLNSKEIFFADSFSAFLNKLVDE